MIHFHDVKSIHSKFEKIHTSIIWLLCVLYLILTFVPVDCVVFITKLSEIIEGTLLIYIAIYIYICKTKHNAHRLQQCDRSIVT